MYAKVGDIDIFYTIAGTGPACLVPSLAGTPIYERTFTPALQEVMQLVFIELRGNRTATGDIDALTFDGMVDDLDGVRRALGLDRGQHLVGQFEPGQRALPHVDVHRLQRRARGIVGEQVKRAVVGGHVAEFSEALRRTRGACKLVFGFGRDGGGSGRGTRRFRAGTGGAGGRRCCGIGHVVFQSVPGRIGSSAAIMDDKPQRFDPAVSGRPVTRCTKESFPRVLRIACALLPDRDQP